MALPINKNNENNSKKTPKNDGDEFIIDETENSAGRKEINNDIFKKSENKNISKKNKSEFKEEKQAPKIEEEPIEVKLSSKKTSSKIKKKSKNQGSYDDILGKKSHKLLWAIVGLVLILLFLAGFIVMMVLNNRDNPSTSANGGGYTEEVAQSGDNGLYEEYNSGDNIDVESETETAYQSLPWYMQTREDALNGDKITEDDAYALIMASVASLPSEEAGYTSNLEDMFLENGDYNPMFSYITQENFSKELLTLLESIVNPVFGNWNDFFNSGDPAAFDKNEALNIFLPETLDNTSPTDLPLLVDPSGNGFGMKGERFNMILNSVDNDFNFDDGVVSVNTVADITLQGKNNAGENVDKHVTVNLNLVQNPAGASEPRLLIRSGSLTEN